MKKHMVAWMLVLCMLLGVGCGKQVDVTEPDSDMPEVQVQQEEEKQPSIADLTEKKEEDKSKEEKKEDKKEEETKKETKEETPKAANQDGQGKTSAGKKTEKSAPAKEKSKEFTSPKSYYVKVNCQMNTVTVYTKDENGHFTVPYKAMVCSTGAETPNGTFDISSCGQWRWLWLVGGVCGQYCTQICGDYLFHSVPYTKWKDKGSLQPGEYDKLGTTCSHGCIRLTVADAKWIYNVADDIAAVKLYRSSDPGPLGKPVAQKIGGSAYKGWDPTDPDGNNPWHNAKVTVGSYVGKTESNAIAAAKELGLSVGSSTYQYSDKAKGTVIGQNPSSGSSVKRGSQITFTVSKGAAPVTVGTYIGKTESNAISAAKSAGLSVSCSYQYSKETAGTVIGQSLSSGSSVSKGTKISFTVSKGEEPVTVGSYIGMTEEEARAAIDNLGLYAEVTYVDGENDNTVIDQSIGAGNSVAAGSTVALTVSQVAEKPVQAEEGQ